MAYAPSTELRAHATNLLAASFGTISDNDIKLVGFESQVASFKTHLEFAHGIKLTAGDTEAMRVHLRGVLGPNLNDSWDGQDFAWSQYVDSVLQFVARRVMDGEGSTYRGLRSTWFVAFYPSSNYTEEVHN